VSQIGEVSVHTLRSIYVTAFKIRQWETRALETMATGAIFFPYWMVKGQELIAATIAQCLEPSDYVVTTYRGTHDQIAKGVPLFDLWSECMGRGTGKSKGKGGTMHISAPDVGLMLTTGIVGGGLPVASGLGLGSQMLGDGRVTVCNFGEGASNSGAFHEALNLASIWNLPVVFVCQNNVYAEHTRFADTARITSVADRSSAYGMRGISVDGNDPDAIYRAASNAVEHARSGQGPVLLECVAFRLSGHGIGDKCEYMDPAERDRHIANDGLPRLRSRLLSDGICTETDLAELEDNSRAEVEESLKRALDAPMPSLDDLTRDVIADRTTSEGPPIRPSTSDDPTLTFRAAINQALDQAMTRDSRVMMFGEDIADDAGGGVFLLSKGLSTKHGSDRVRNTPITETAIIGAAVGAAMAGLRPVAEIMMMDFLGVCFDQLVNHAAKLRYMSGGQTPVPLTVRVGMLGGSPIGAQHTQSLEALLMHTPGLKVVYPGTPYDAKGLLAACIADDDPCVFIEANLLMNTTGHVPEQEYTIPIGVADIKRSGSDVTVITYGRNLPDALEAADELAGTVSVEVLDLRTVAPMDIEAILSSVAKTGRAIIVHDAVKTCGAGAEISALIHEQLAKQLRAPIKRLTAPDTPSPASPTLVAALYPTKNHIVDACKAIVQ
jgi:pyruvate/2-oxoglutarate/acetoin dehydrogenase E1 component/TPP-dependent pyruvate/acetoin dehydrogenase alpha subunit